MAYLGFCEGEGSGSAEGARFETPEAPWRVRCGRWCPLSPGGSGQGAVSLLRFFLICGSNWAIFVQTNLAFRQKGGGVIKCMSVVTLFTFCIEFVRINMNE